MNKVLDFYNKYELPIFIVITLLTSAQVFLYWVFPTLDGPHHIHNSNVILGMLQGNELFHKYYYLHPLPVSNLIGHGLLSLFNFVLPSNQALNLLVFLYMVGMAFGFRYLLISATGRFSPLGYGVFPFITNITLILGLFNFCLGIVLFLFVLGFWFRVNKDLNIKRLLQLGFLLMLMMFTHVMSFAIFGLSLIVFMAYEFATKLLSTDKLDYKYIFLKVIRLAIIAIPPLIVFYFYQQTMGELVMKNLGTDTKDNVSLLQNFYYVRPLVIYRVHEDGMTNLPLFIVLMGLVLVYVVSTLKKWIVPDKNAFNRGFLLTMTVLFMLLILITPPGFLLHTMLMRLSLLFFLFLLMWLSSIRFAGWLELLCAIFFLGVFTEHQFRMGSSRSDFSIKAMDMHTITDYMEPNTVFFPINGESVWVNQYVMNYVGSEKQFLNVLNPQAYGPFPVVYDHDNMPYTTFGGFKQQDIHFYFRSGYWGKEEHVIDYVVVFRDECLQELREDAEYDSFFSILDAKYEFVVESPRRFGTLYRIKQD